MNFKDMACMLVRPPSKVILAKRIKNSKDYQELLTKAKDENLCLYYATVQQQNGKSQAIQPWVLDKDSLPQNIDILLRSKKESTQEVIQEIDPLQCPYCSKKCSSSSGKTLHLKNSHPDKYAESIGK